MDDDDDDEGDAQELQKERKEPKIHSGAGKDTEANNEGKEKNGDMHG